MLFWPKFDRGGQRAASTLVSEVTESKDKLVTSLVTARGGSMSWFDVTVILSAEIESN